MRPVALARTLGTLWLLGAALPANLLVTAVAVVHGLLRPRHAATAAEPRTVLLTGGKMTKALQLARSFHAAGHRVVLAETARYRLSGHRFSRAVDAFHVVPSPTDPGYADALLDVVRTEGVDVYVPVCSPVASRQDALAAATLAPHCEVLHVDADVIGTLDDKDRFAEAAAGLGLRVPDTHRVTDAQQVVDFDWPEDRTYILKSIAYDPVHRLDLTRLPLATRGATAAHVARLPISASNPWILQEFVEGQEYCTHSTVRDGQVRVWACCRSSPFQVNYAMDDHPDVRAWVTRFVDGLQLTGQASFDHIVTADGEAVGIECNPRTHSAITMFHDEPGLADAYLTDGADTLVPREGSRPTYWLYHELWRMLTRPASVPERLGVLLRGKDALYDPHDPLPFLLVPHLQVPSLLLGTLLRGAEWLRIDFNIGKLIEPGGD